MRDFLYRVFIEDFLLKAFALIIAVGLAIFVRTELEQSTTLYVRVQYIEPRGRIMVSDQKLDQVRVAVRGPWARISRIEDNAIQPIVIDMSNLSDGELRFAPEMVRLPPGLRVESFTPIGMYMHFEPEVTVSLGVNLTIEGEPPEGYRFRQATPSPRVVRLRGAQNVLESMHHVLSRPVSVVNIRDTVMLPVELAPLPKHVRLADDPPPKMSATIFVELVERHYSNVPIRPSGQIQNVTLSPESATVVLRGQGLDRFLDMPQLVLDTIAEERKPVGTTFRKRPQIVNLPPGIAYEIQPAEVEFTILRTEPDKPARKP
ncbi:MAG: CdaR family protein [Polyangia bacterium]